MLGPGLMGECAFDWNTELVVCPWAECSECCEQKLDDDQEANPDPRQLAVREMFGSRE
jgi:hypothetical protein